MRYKNQCTYVGKLRASLSICLATLIWGFAFIVGKVIVTEMHPLWFVVVRWLICLATCFVVIAASTHFRRGLTLKAIRAALWPGVMLGIIFVTQVIGIRHTSATNSAFLSSTYCLFVPLIQFAAFRERISKPTVACIFCALLGVALIAPLSLSMNIGDLLALVTGLLYAAHIVLVSRLTPRQTPAFVFNACQMIWMGLIPLMAAIALRIPWQSSGLTTNILGFFYLGAAVLTTSFFLLVKAQKTLDANTVGILLLLECPFAAWFDRIVFHHVMSAEQIVGAALILGASAAATLLKS
jgi:drug/metabolite transporter (DMT)-like permease